MNDNLFTMNGFSPRVEKIKMEDFDWMMDPAQPGRTSAETIQDDVEQDDNGNYVVAWNYCECCESTDRGRGNAFGFAQHMAMDRLIKMSADYVHGGRHNTNVARAVEHPHPFVHRDAWLSYDLFSPDYTREDYPGLYDPAYLEGSGLTLRSEGSVTDFMQQHGLVIQFDENTMTPVESEDPHAKIPKFKGMWAITDRGLAFMANQVRLPTRVIVSANRNRKSILRARSYQVANVAELNEDWLQRRKAGAAIYATTMLAYGIDDLSNFIGEYFYD